jgi:hypothetical protein
MKRLEDDRKTWIGERGSWIGRSLSQIGRHVSVVVVSSSITSPLISPRSPHTVFPLVRHQISDLPEANQTTMKGLYVFWLALIGTLVINLVACILLLIAGSSDGGWVELFPR